MNGRQFIIVASIVLFYHFNPLQMCVIPLQETDTGQTETYHPAETYKIFK